MFTEPRNYRITGGVVGALVLPPIGAVVSCLTLESFFGMFTVCIVPPVAFIVSIPAGYAVGWFTVMFVQGLLEERQTRVSMRKDDDEDYRHDNL
jgi:hypothetical protein